MKIDEKDVVLIRMLKENSRLSLKEMARELGMSETAVKKRVENLKMKGVIKKFTIDINEKAVGFAKAVVCLDTSNTESAAAFIKKLPFVSSIALSSGSHNLVVEIEGPEGLVPGVFERIRRSRFVKRACCSVVVRWL